MQCGNAEILQTNEYAGESSINHKVMAGVRLRSWSSKHNKTDGKLRDNLNDNGRAGARGKRQERGGAKSTGSLTDGRSDRQTKRGGGSPI